jgi:hypothetical protein
MAGALGAGTLAVISAGPAVAAAGVPAWEPDPNSASPFGTVGFYDSTGNVVTQGANLNHLFDYAVASTPLNPAGSTKATLYFAAPDHTQPTASWATDQVSASTTFPNANAPTPLNSVTNPLVTLTGADANLNAALGGFTLDSTTGYANIIQVRLVDSGRSGGSLPNYWSADIAYNTGASVIVVDGVNVNPGSWVELYPAPTSTTTTVATSGSPSVVGQQVTYTATVSPSPVTGTVAFTDAGSPISGCGAQPVSAGTATCNVTYTSAGSHTIAASYSGDPFFNSSTTGSSITQTVNKAQTSTTVGSAPGNPAADNVPVTYTATVTVTGAGSGTPTGTVGFTDGGTPIAACTAQPLSGSPLTATCAVAAYGSPGSHTIVATYSGDSGFSTSASSPLIQGIVGASTTTAVTSPGAVVIGESVTYTATVTPAPDGGTVSFSDGGTAISGCGTQTVTSGTATCTTTPSTAGTHTIVATYSGDSNYAQSTSPNFSQTVNKASTTTAVTSPGAITVGQPVTYTATVSVTAPGSGSPAGSVAFFDGGTAISGCGTQTVTSGTATCTTTPSTAGNHTITATYSGNASYLTSTSPGFSQTVNKAVTSTAVSSPGATVTGQAVTYTATVTATGSPTGTVAFSDGGTAIAGCGAKALASGTATCTTTPTTAGTHTITAVYTGDANFLTSTSPGFSQTVNKAATSASVASSANPSFTGQVITYTATVAVTAPGTGAPTGTVDFKDGGTDISGCSALPLSAGKATCTPSPAYSSAGSHTITATYAGDANYAASPASPSLNQTVQTAVPPTAPTGLTAQGGDAKAVLTWKVPSSDGGSAITGYDVYVGTTPGGESATAVNASPVAGTTYTVSGLTNGQKYYFTVKAINAAGVSVASNEASATPAATGYVLFSGTGKVYAYGGATTHGSLAGVHLSAPVVGMAITPDKGGYWMVSSDGGVFAFGDAHFYGSLGGIKLAAPIVGMAMSPSGHGYVLVAADGGVFRFGDAGFYGSLGGIKLAAPIVGVAMSPSGHGYVLVAADGGVFRFGDAGFFGSLGGVKLAAPIVAIVLTPDGGGYQLTGNDGGVFSFGDAVFAGSAYGPGTPAGSILGATS